MIQLFKLSAANYWQNKVYAALVMATLLTACAGLTAVQVINATAKQSYASASQPLINNVTWRVVAHGSAEQLTKFDYAELRKAGFTHLVPVLRSRQELTATGSSESFELTLVGIDGFALLSLSANRSDKAPTAPLPDISQLWQPPYSAFIHPQLLKQLSIFQNDALQLTNKRTLPQLTPLEQPGLSREIVLDIGVLQSLLDTSALSELLVVGELPAPKQQTLRQQLPAHLTLQQLHTEDSGQLTDSFHLNLLAMALLMFVVCLFVVMNALNLLFAKRIGHYRICRQLGVSKQQILSSMYIELLIVSLLCAPVGTVLGYWLADMLSPAVQQTLAELYNTQIGFNQPGFVNTWLQSTVICVLGTSAAALMPAWQLSYRLQRKQTPFVLKQRFWVLSILLLAAIGLIVGISSTSLLSSFAIIACLLLAGAALMVVLQPLLIQQLTPLAKQISVLTHWAVANSLQLSGRSKIAFAAFFIAVASNIGMNIMVDSFRQATENWLTNRLVAPHYLYPEDAQGFARWLEQHGSALPLVPRYRTEATSETTKINLYSYPAREDYQSALGLKQSMHHAWPEFNQGQGVFVNQQLAARKKLALGDTLSMQLASEQIIVLPVLGIYYDYGNPNSQALVALKHFPPSYAAYVYALHTDNQELIETLSKHSAEQQIALDIYPVQQILDAAMQAFDRTFVITNGLNAITLLVAALSLTTSILLIAIDNSSQQALLRSLGVSGVQLLCIRLGQFLLLGTISCLLAIPFGLGLSYLLVDLVNWRAFSWSYPVLLDMQTCFEVIGMTLIALLVAALLPLLYQFKRPLAEEIKWLQ